MLPCDAATPDTTGSTEGERARGEKGDTPAATGRDTRRLQVGAAETSGMRCPAGLCRDTKPKSPQRRGSRDGQKKWTSQRRGRRVRLPRQRERNDAATSHPSGSAGSPISYTVHSTTRHELRDLSAGPEGDGWRRVYVTSPPQFCRPWGPGTANHLIRHDAHNQGPADWRCF